MSFFSNRSEGVVGVDISSTGIKLVELSHSGSGYELTSLATVPLPRDAIVENTIIDSTAVSQALIEAVNTAKPSTKNVALAVSGNAVIIKTIAIPTVSEFELEAQIQFEADEHIPYDIDDVFLDFSIQGMTADNPELMDVVLVACKREVVEDYQMVLAEAGLTAKCVDCAVFALENAAEETGGYAASKGGAQLLEDEDADVHALINIGANMMNINVLINGQMAFVRDQYYGGQNLTEEIQKEHGISHHAAEQLKTDDFDSIHPEALERFYVGLTSELVRSLDFYSASKAEFPVRKLLLSGGCALIPNIATELEQRLGIDTAVLNPLDNIKISTRKFDEQHLRRIGPMLMVPIGLAMRSFDS
ncbi:type IV pilus assembly protein PilM [Mariprofundus aestuarium]|uniref:Type IV pilus assembly protein PilM n=1 Tax=Mariprofundus aestuarium TaxID=1921086 RepID=A0A2K8KVU5_MARES|nr:type IV pilus assembly protein PilM [Mariprofundus aestuarium]ATX78965.1 type IV pilus assembly protein PilM [Mariprofundus aestuarium]